MPALIRGVKASAMPVVSECHGRVIQSTIRVVYATGPTHLTIMMTEGCLDMVPYAVS